MSTQNRTAKIEVRKFLFKHGSEGPWHDPYAYFEVICKFKTSNMPKVVELVYHTGLIEYLEADGQPITQDLSMTAKLFEKYVGINPMLIEQILDKRHARKCPKCGCRRTKDERGYPGESFLVCAKCGEVRETFFKLSEVI